MLSSSASSAIVQLGYSAYFEEQFARLLSESPRFSDWSPERVTVEHRGEYGLLGGDGGARRAVLSGRLSRQLPQAERPCVGDFVLAAPSSDGALTRIEFVFRRASAFLRKTVGGTASAQPVAANVDLGIIMAALASEDADPHAIKHGLNLRRIERYLRAIADAPARPLIVLSKADLAANAGELSQELSRELGEVEILAVSAVTGQGIDALAAKLGFGVTAVLVGSSGVGKSSLINRLLRQDAQKIAPVRESDARGRHTTSHRELFALPSGGLLIDTPGMRELSLFADESTDTRSTGFEDIDALAARCRFRNCQHSGEPGCAVLEAVTRGELSEARVTHSRLLVRELERQQARHDGHRQREERQRQRAQSRAVRSVMRRKGRDS